ncbi:sodium channel, non-voltage-gated 1, gamma [Cichlidogyrus casuarinus]|uniref:Sodium channel, non-voltage-gated 1, gamma n=1 Tax=Cichlidogyrus casuarinus TaxID=1844966 RepID=A0ABD2PWK9_9PLAT
MGATRSQRIWKGIRKELKDFSTNTSIRGLPRIARANHRSIRLLWTAYVLLLLTGLTVCMCYLTSQFLEYDVIHPPRLLHDVPAPFPSVTICNLRPLGSNGKTYIAKNNFETPLSFASKMNELTYKRFKSSDYWIVSSAFSITSYLESMEPQVRNSMGHNISDAIFLCQASYLQNNTHRTQHCNTLGTWKSFLHPKFVNCSTLTLRPEYINSTNSMEMIIYLDESLDEIECIDCFRRDIRTQLSGVMVTLHRPNTYPDINNEGESIRPGTYTEIRLETREQRMLTPPYGRCSKSNLTKQTLKFDGHDYVYSEYACKEAIKQVSA